jgi:hypothetical protein
MSTGTARRPGTGKRVSRALHDDLTERHGFGPMGSVRPPTFAAFSLQDDPDGLWVAEESDQILGFGFSWVCGDLWFLAQLFVAPGQQASGLDGHASPIGNRVPIACGAAYTLRLFPTAS